MIKVKIQNKVIEVKGHANYSAHGTDIVCASVSTSVIMTINLIEIFNLKNDISVEVKDGFTKINIINESDELNKIINNLIFTISDLEIQYPRYIKIEK